MYAWRSSESVSKMSSCRLQSFRSLLTERFTAVAMEVFGEVESIVVECREENRRLRNILHMVLDPEIKLHHIDINNYTREQPSEANTGVDLEISTGLTTKAKAEQIEYDISWDQRRALAEADNFITPDCVKEEHVEHDISLEQYPGLGEVDNVFTSDCLKNESKEEDIADTNPIHVAYNRLEASANNSADEANEYGDCASHKSEADCQSEEGTSESHRFQKDPEPSKTEDKMYCPFCGFQFENLIKFCCSCGKVISFVPAKNASTAAEQEQSRANTVVQQFFKYSEGKVAERRMFSKSKKKSNKTVKISVGIMNKKRTSMRPIRGKTLPLTVEPSWSSEKLLGAAIKKLKDFNQDMKDAEYILLYPDGSQIKNIPGTDTPFTIELYKEAVGKSYQRITLFVCTLEEFLSEYGSVSEDDEDDEVIVRVPPVMSTPL